MNKLYAIFALLVIPVFANAQCTVQIQWYDVLCYGDCNGIATAYANGTSPITYLWLPGGQTTPTINGLCPGTYTVQITDSTGCVATATCMVTQPPQLQAMITSFQNPSCQACCDGFATGTASGGIPSYSFSWMPTSQSAPTAQQLCVGTYTFCVTDLNGCVSCDTVSLSFPSSITEPVNTVEMIVYGADGLFNLAVHFPEVRSGQVVVTNAMGGVVSVSSFEAQSSFQQLVDLTGKPSGLYLISVVTEQGLVTEKVILP